MSKGAYGIDTDKAMDEMSPPEHESGKVGGAKKSGRFHSLMAEPMKGAEHSPMPMHEKGVHPLSHYDKMYPKK